MITDAFSRGLKVLTLEQIMAAVDTLNSFVRSPSCASMGYGYTYKHYFYRHIKRHAIRRLNEEGPCSHRRICVWAKCKSCGGTGNWREANSYRGAVKCYTCGGDGNVQLRFIETHVSVGPGYRWHTPAIEWSHITSEDVESGEPPADWKPNTPGKDLTPEQFAVTTVVAETAFPRHCPVHGPSSYQRDAYNDVPESDCSMYPLYIGDTDASRCSLCGDPPTAGAYACCEGHLRWTDHVCAGCKRHFELLAKAGGVGNIYKALHPPKHLLAKPEFSAWVEFQYVNRMPIPF